MLERHHYFIAPYVGKKAMLSTNNIVVDKGLILFEFINNSCEHLPSSDFSMEPFLAHPGMKPIIHNKHKNIYSFHSWSLLL